MILSIICWIFSGGGALFFLKSWRPFLVVVLNTQANTAKLTTPTLQNSPLSKKFPLKINFWLTTYRNKLRPQLFSPPWLCLWYKTHQQTAVDVSSRQRSSFDCLLFPSFHLNAHVPFQNTLRHICSDDACSAVNVMRTSVDLRTYSATKCHHTVVSSVIALFYTKCRNIR